MTEEERELRRKRKTSEAVKEESVDNADIGGITIGVLLVGIAEHYGLALSPQEYSLFVGFLGVIGARIKDRFKK